MQFDRLHVQPIIVISPPTFLCSLGHLCSVSTTVSVVHKNTKTLDLVGGLENFAFVVIQNISNQELSIIVQNSFPTSFRNEQIKRFRTISYFKKNVYQPDKFCPSIFQRVLLSHPHANVNQCSSSLPRLERPKMIKLRFCVTISISKIFKT